MEINIKLDLTYDEIKAIDDLKRYLGLDSNADVIAYATAILLKIKEGLDKGDSIIIESSKPKESSGYTYKIIV